MRLLHTKELYLENFTNDIPAYAILSHTWVDKELLFEHIHSSGLKEHKGFAKVRNCCDVAIRYGYDWVWIDTCCIDKSSSAELSEAINSMFAWYKSSAVCFAYLADVDGTDIFKARQDNQNTESGYPVPRWFTRGWTLQELIAPRDVEFYNSSWLQIGTKRSLCDELAQITHINKFVLRGADPTYYPVAERMSWASNRTTTRSEDIAYCLLGLFNVNMPLLYGEGDRAFQRLQEEIMKVVDDYTLFTWNLPYETDTPSFATTGILAASPHDFGITEDLSVAVWSNPQPFMDTPSAGRLIHRGKTVNSWCLEPPVVTSRGVRITTPIIHKSPTRICAALYLSQNHKALVCLHLQPTVNSSIMYGRVLRQPIELVPLLPGEQLEVDIMTFYAQTAHSRGQSWQPNWLNLRFMQEEEPKAIFVTNDASNELLKIITFRWGYSLQNSGNAIAIFELSSDITDFSLVFGIHSTGNGYFPWCRIEQVSGAVDKLLTWTKAQFEVNRLSDGGPDRSLVDYDRKHLGFGNWISASVRTCPSPLPDKYPKLLGKKFESKWGALKSNIRAWHIQVSIHDSSEGESNPLSLSNYFLNPRLAASTFEGSDLFGLEVKWSSWLD